MWINDDVAADVTGHLTVKTPLAIPGQITLPQDLTSFVFTVDTLTWVTADVTGAGPIPVNDRFEPTETDKSEPSAITATLQELPIIVQLDATWAIPAGEQAIIDNTGAVPQTFFGHWSITQSSVPEPSSAALASIAVVGGFAYGWRRRRRA
jgi:hypothetical protein